MLRRFILLLVTLGFGLGPALNAARADDQSYACTALKQDAGREEADMASPLYWWDDGRLRMVEKDQEAYYFGPAPSDDGVTWLDIYAVPNGHGNTFLGYYLKSHFNCVTE